MKSQDLISSWEDQSCTKQTVMDRVDGGAGRQAHSLHTCVATGKPQTSSLQTKWQGALIHSLGNHRKMSGLESI